jgi:3'(2'), 5'-bisphosphate nucleotidase
MSYSQELRVAELAVQRADILTKKVFREKAKGTLSKDDKSPVTIGDFGAQALIIQAIKGNFPTDEIVGEEEASSLRGDGGLSSQIWDLIKDVKVGDPESDSILGGLLPSESTMLDLIDQGNSAGGARGRIWALDPIDGTKGFLRGGQYAICQALLVDGDVKVGVLGCPNLPVDDSAPLTEEAFQLIQLSVYFINILNFQSLLDNIRASYNLIIIKRQYFFRQYIINYNK